MSEQELFEKNLVLTTEFGQYLLEHPEIMAPGDDLVDRPGILNTLRAGHKRGQSTPRSRIQARPLSDAEYRITQFR